MKREPIAIVGEFLETWNASSEELEAAVRTLFTPDTEWEILGISRTVGADAALAMGAELERRIGYSRIEVETLHIAANGDVVLTERIDRLLDADGGLIGSFAIMGVFELNDVGKLVRWRDYTDPGAIASLPKH